MKIKNCLPAEVSAQAGKIENYSNMNSKKIIEHKLDHEAKVSTLAKADKAWLDYAGLAPDSRTARKLAELWSEKEHAKVELKKFLK